MIFKTGGDMSEKDKSHSLGHFTGNPGVKKFSLIQNFIFYKYTF